MSQKNKNLLARLISTMIFMYAIFPVIASSQSQTVGTPPPSQTVNTPSTNIVINNPFKAKSIQQLISILIDDILIPVGGVVAVLMIMWAGFLFVTARGDAAQITKARTALTYAVIGAAILLGAKIISEAIQSTVDQLRTP